MSNVASSTSTDLSIKKRVENLKTEYTELIEKQTALAAAQAELSKAIADKEAYFQSEEYLKIEAQYNSIENLIQQALEKKKGILGKKFNETKERAILEIFFYGDTGSYEKMRALEQQMVKHILATNGKRVEKLKTTGFLYLEEGDEIQTQLMKEEKSKLQPLTQSNITEITPVERTYQGDPYHIITCKIRGEPYTAIQVPHKLKEMKYQDTHMGNQLMKFKGENWYPAFLTDEKLEKPLNQDRLIRKTEPAMQENGTPHTDIKLYTDGDPEGDIIRACAKKGMRTLTITDCVIMAELIKGRFGEEYLWEEFTEDNFGKTKTEASHKSIQEKLKKIEDEFGMKYVVNTKDAQGYLNWEYGMYKREKPRNRTASGGSKVKEYFSGFFRGSFDSDRPTLGGVASVRLNGGLGGSSSRFGFRPSV